MKLTKTTFFLGCLTGGIGAAFVPMLLTSTQAQTKLLPFQGRLTNADGTPITPDQAKVVEFKMYDAPTGGNVKWAGEVHKLSVNGGLVNTMLGSKASLGSVDFSTPCYLQITVDAQATGAAGNGVSDAADPPLLPQQSVVPAVYAVESGNARALDGSPADYYKAVFDQADPATGRLLGTKIKDNSLPMLVFTPDSITASQIGAGAVQESELKDGAVSLKKLAAMTVGQFDVPVGGIAISNRSASGFTFSSRPPETTVTNLNVSLTVSGRPVEVALLPDPASTATNGGGIYISVSATSQIGGLVRIYRSEVDATTGADIAATKTVVQLFNYYLDSFAVSSVLHPPSTARCIDLSAAAGKKYRYTVTMEGAGSSWSSPDHDRFGLSGVKLMAREL